MLTGGVDLVEALSLLLRKLVMPALLICCTHDQLSPVSVDVQASAHARRDYALQLDSMLTLSRKTPLVTNTVVNTWVVSSNSCRC